MIKYLALLYSVMFYNVDQPERKVSIVAEDFLEMSKTDEGCYKLHNIIFAETGVNMEISKLFKMIEEVKEKI